MPKGRMLSLIMSLGVLGGALLVLSFVFFTPGKFLLIPYGAMVVGSIAVARAERLQSFRSRFVVLLSSFMLASLALYSAVTVVTSAEVGLLGHAWRIAFLLLVGVATNLGAAVIAGPPVSTHPQEAVT